MQLPVGRVPGRYYGGFFQPCLGQVLEEFLVEGVWWLCFWAAEWAEGRALKVLEGRVDSEPRRELVLKVDRTYIFGSWDADERRDSV